MIYRSNSFSLNDIDKNVYDCELHIVRMNYDNWIESIYSVKSSGNKIHYLEGSKLYYGDSLYINDNNNYYCIAVNRVEP